MIYILFGSTEVRIFALLFHCFVYWHHYDVTFCDMVFKFAYFVEFWIGYQPAKLQCWRLSLASFIDRLKNKRMTSSWRYFMLLGFENLKLCEFKYRLLPLQVSNRLVASNFMEFSVRHKKHNYDIISYYWVSIKVYFVEHDIGYQPSKFQCSRISGLNFMEGGGPPVPQRDKKVQCL